MLANLNHKRNRKPVAVSRRARLNVVGESDGLPDEVSVLSPPTVEAPAFPGAGSIRGTVGAAVEPIDQQAYSDGSEAVLNDAPLGSTRNPKVNDLLSELREISGQVNRMMDQVDRAIHRLGEHAGEPLKR